MTNKTPQSDSVAFMATPQTSYAPLERRMVVPLKFAQRMEVERDNALKIIGSLSKILQKP
tara:strand:+ start:159 stop:338 length:180 start_codon:yes stop_codon:yes gene_type:complete